jgi:hypothetical protein
VRHGYVSDNQGAGERLCRLWRVNDAPWNAAETLSLKIKKKCDAYHIFYIFVVNQTSFLWQAQ